MRILVTGASGFIGSAFVRRTLEVRQDVHIVGLARNTHQKHLDRLRGTESNNHFDLVFGDLLGDISGLCEGVDAVVNFAAKTFVDHSIKHPAGFVEANVLGTACLLEEARRQNVPKFVQISTDEVYGPIWDSPAIEYMALRPSNPYAASKAGAEMMAISYAVTYGMNISITRCVNNYGPWQHPQKVIPTFCRSALCGEPLPVYGDGLHRRQWIHVDDHNAAVLDLIDEPDVGTVWNIGPGESGELTNLELAKRVLAFFGRPDNDIEYIDDKHIRPGHDRRYAIGCRREPTLSKPLDRGLEETFDWMKTNRWWLE